ncbi:MAG: hypothetical protein SFV19_14935 [Rhodospirillaceae bacterium]|nr:hypothetical protein [Rhodospirillaceae bacterium]
MNSFRIALAVLVSCVAAPASAAPGYEQDRKQLEQVLADLIAWLPGAWDSYPQVYYENNYAMPKEGEHEHWHRTFARIDAPQVGEVVFYGQINAGGRNGPIIGGSQVLYKAVIDKKLGAVNIFGQGPLDPEKYENLHVRPELWGEVKMRDPAALNCDFIWRRDVDHIFGVLQGNTPEKQKYGPGTCAFLSVRSGVEFRGDAEWALNAEKLWLYDNNWQADMLVLGREDRTHIQMYRARPYTCEVKDASGRRQVDAHDRGHKMEVSGNGGRKLELLLLRAEYPADVGLSDRLKLMLTDPTNGKDIGVSEAAPLAKSIDLKSDGVAATCRLASKFPPMALQ